MSDKQKGLLAAFESVLPGVDNRFCVRHLHGNMKKAGFKGDLLKDLLWDAARACTVPAFNQVMTQIKGVDVKCFEWLQSKPPREWSRSHFTTIGKCDTLVNNMCEQINNCILDARDKPILTMLEWIRQYLMGKLQRYRDKADRKWENKKICPRIEKLLEANQKHIGDCIPIKSNEFLYEVSSIRDGSRYAVDLEKMTCDCRRWELSGIPCEHAISAISAERSDPTDFVSSCYSVDTYKDVYVHAIMPMADAELWEKTGFIPPLPPAILKKKKCGRPPRQRKFSANESPSKKKKKSGFQKIPRQTKPKQKKAKKQLNEKVTTEQPREEPIEDGGITDLTLPENDGITDLTLPDVIENMTQHEDLQETQLEESVQDIPLRPTTAKGRKLLATRKAVAAAAERSTFKPPEQIREPRQSSSLQIREPPPMSFHPGCVVGGSSLAQTVAEKEKDVGGLKVFTAGGKKFTNLSSLNAASRKKRGGKS
ncbi:hypothetical protein C2S52_013588 [Perilla frutescens var. hirtella]|nr:hypothetical protein C2S52_013588 [Perilla frutescens var. hirtella]